MSRTLRATFGLAIACALYALTDLGWQMLVSGATFDQALNAFPARAWKLIPWLITYGVFYMTLNSDRRASEA